MRVARFIGKGIMGAADIIATALCLAAIAVAIYYAVDFIF